MRITRALPRLFAGGLAALALCSAGLTIGPAPAAHAQSNYRVCGAWNSAQSRGEIGTGLVTKVYKGGTGTCGDKLNYMRHYYGSAYQGSSPDNVFVMMSCEEFGDRIGMTYDPCGFLAVNQIYKYTSPNDRVHPNPVYFSFWHS